MIPFCNGNAITTALLGETSKADTLNEDYNWHLQNAPALMRDPWLIRILPAFIRVPYKARREARAYEDALIAMWEKSPHLLDDIGIVLATDGDIPEHLVSAPARVVDHVRASVKAKATLPAAPAPVDTPAAPIVPARSRDLPAVSLSGLPA